MQQKVERQDDTERSSEREGEKSGLINSGIYWVKE